MEAGQTKWLNKNWFKLLIVLILCAIAYTIYYAVVKLPQQKNEAQQATAQAAAATQLEQQKQCDSLQLEYRSECFQIGQENYQSMNDAIKNTCGYSNQTCTQNIMDSFTGKVGEPFIVQCENIRLAENSCPAISQ